MRVLVVSHLYPAPGYERHLFLHEQLVALRRLGVEATVCSPTPLAPRVLWFRSRWRRFGSKPRRAIRDGIEATYPRVVVLPRRALFSRSGDLFYLAMRRQLPAAAGQVDLIHAHQALPDGAAAARMAARLGVPFVVTVHGRDVNAHLPAGGAVARRTVDTLSRAAAVVAVSGAVARRLAGYVDSDRLHVVPNGVIGGGRAVAPADFLGDKPLVLSVGYLIVSKGHATVLDALALLRDDHPGIEYAIVGEGACEAELRRQADRLGLAPRVHFLGRLTHDDVLRMMARADLFVLPSAPEGFGLVYAEAMGQGTPVVACRGEGPQDFVTDGVSGYLVPPRDARALANAMARAFDDPDERRRMGEAGSAAVAGLTWDRSAALLLAVYEQVIAETRSETTS